MRGYLGSRWKVWAPPVVVTLLVFGGLLLFVQGNKLSLFTYKLF
jgi:hypothetical protein